LGGISILAKPEIGNVVYGYAVIQELAASRESRHAEDVWLANQSRGRSSE